MDAFWKKISEDAVSDETIRLKVADLKKQLQESIKKVVTEVRSEVAGDPLGKQAELKELNTVSSMVGEKLAMMLKNDYKYTGGLAGCLEQPAAKKTKLREAPARAPASGRSPGTPSAQLPPPTTPTAAAPSGSLPTGAASSVVVWGGGSVPDGCSRCGQR